MNVFKTSINAITVKLVELPERLVQIGGRVVEAHVDTGAQKSFMSGTIVKKYFYFKKLQ